MGSSGGVVITAAFVFAFTMLALLASDVKNIGQAGSTICIGLIFDMLVVRLCLVLPVARVLGPWFWWPQRISSRPREPVESAPVGSWPDYPGITGNVTADGCCAS